MANADANEPEVTIHVASWWSAATRGFVPSVLICLGGAALVLFAAVELFVTPGPDVNRAALRGQTAVAAAVAGSVFAVGWLLPVFRIRRVLLSPQGLEWDCLGRTHERRWDEVVAAYYSDVRRGDPDEPNPLDTRLASVRLVFGDGQSVRLNQTLQRFDDVAGRVIHATTAALLPDARAELETTGVRFGPVRLAEKGITSGGKVTAWDKVSEVWLANGHLCYRSGKGAVKLFRVAEVPNLMVLLALVRERIGDRCRCAKFDV